MGMVLAVGAEPAYVAMDGGAPAQEPPEAALRSPPIALRSSLEGISEPLLGCSDGTAGASEPYLERHMIRMWTREEGSWTSHTLSLPQALATA